MAEQSYIPYREIVDQLDVRASDILIIASDITRLAFLAKRNEGSFDAGVFIDSFTQKLGPSGTLVLPAYNFSLLSGQAFDPSRTPPTTGAMALSAFKRDDFIRTWHPLHSFLVWGNKTDELKALRNPSSFGHDSPFAKFLEWNAKMLFIGTNVAEAFTYTHHVEEMEKVRYRYYNSRNISYYEDGEYIGKKKFLLFQKRWGWTMNMLLLQEQLESSVLNTKMIGKIECSLLNISDADKIIRKDIIENKAAKIVRFDRNLFVRDFAKSFMHSLNLYKTTQDKINYGTGI